MAISENQKHFFNNLVSNLKLKGSNLFETAAESVNLIGEDRSEIEKKQTILCQLALRPRGCAFDMRVIYGAVVEAGSNL